DSIMGALPLAKAGVGSAMNDTTRQVGGALGVAVLGSLLTAGYGSSIGDFLRRHPLPATTTGDVKRSVGAAMQEAQRIGGASGAALRTAARRASVDATREILAEEGYAGLTIEGVAARAGVGKATVYRRWPGKVELVVDVISETAAEQVPIPDTGSTRGDLVVLVRTIIDVLTTTNAGAITAAMVAECSRNPELAHAFRTGFVAVRRAAVVDLIERGVARGDLRPDVD